MMQKIDASAAQMYEQAEKGKRQKDRERAIAQKKADDAQADIERKRHELDERLREQERWFAAYVAKQKADKKKRLDDEAERIRALLDENRKRKERDALEKEAEARRAEDAKVRAEAQEEIRRKQKEKEEQHLQKRIDDVAKNILNYHLRSKGHVSDEELQRLTRLANREASEYIKTEDDIENNMVAINKYRKDMIEKNGYDVYAEFNPDYVHRRIWADMQKGNRPASPRANQRQVKKKPQSANTLCKCWC
jgi:hypothetical protein